MQRANLEHLIRSAGAIAECKEIIIIGSQSILGKYPNAPKEALLSMEADLIPVGHPERLDLIDGVLGELSSFHNSFGYYGDGCDETTSILPKGWKGRLIAIDNPNTNGIKGLCLDPHDMAISKLVAGRDKDIKVCSVLFNHNILIKELLLKRLDQTDIGSDIFSKAKNNIEIVTARPSNPQKPSGMGM